MNLFTALVIVAFVWLVSVIRSSQAEQEEKAWRYPVPATLLDDLINMSFPRRPPLPRAVPHQDIVSESSPTPEVEVPQPDTVFFKPGEPQSFADYHGQQRVVAKLEDAVRAAQPVPRRGVGDP